MKYIYSLNFRVRDYECDLQGIVNNANYQHYTEHTRNEFLRAHGLNFAELHDQGIDTVVARLSMQFKSPLRSGDDFVTRLALRKEGLRYVFMQDIYRLPDEKIVLKAVTDIVCLVNGRLQDCQLLNERFKDYL